MTYIVDGGGTTVTFVRCHHLRLMRFAAISWAMFSPAVQCVFVGGKEVAGDRKLGDVARKE